MEIRRRDPSLLRQTVRGGHHEQEFFADGGRLHEIVGGGEAAEGADAVNRVLGFAAALSRATAR